MFHSKQYIQQLRQRIHDRRAFDTSPLPGYFADGTEGMADIMENVADQMPDAGGNLATSMSSFAFRFISSGLRLYVLLKEQGWTMSFDMFMAMFDIVLTITTGILILVVTELVQLILELVFSFYWLIKDGVDFIFQTQECRKIQDLEQWINTLGQQSSEALTLQFSEAYKMENESRIEALFIRNLVLTRMRKRSGLSEKMEIQWRYMQHIIQNTGYFRTEKIHVVLDLYKRQGFLFDVLNMHMQQWDPEEASDLPEGITVVHQKLMDIALALKPYIASHQFRYTEDGEMESTGTLENLMDSSVNMNLSLCGLVLATLALVIFICVVPQSLVFFAAPLVLEVIAGLILLTRFILECVSSWQEEENLELEILEKAQTGEYGNLFMEDGTDGVEPCSDTFDHMEFTHDYKNIR